MGYFKNIFRQRELAEKMKARKEPRQYDTKFDRMLTGDTDIDIVLRILNLQHNYQYFDSLYKRDMTALAGADKELKEHYIYFAEKVKDGTI